MAGQFKEPINTQERILWLDVWVNVGSKTDASEKGIAALKAFSHCLYDTFNKSNLTLTVSRCNNRYFQPLVCGYLLISAHTHLIHLLPCPFFYGWHHPCHRYIKRGSVWEDTKKQTELSHRDKKKNQVERGNRLKAGACKANKRTLWIRERQGVVSLSTSTDVHRPRVPDANLTSFSARKRLSCQWASRKWKRSPHFFRKCVLKHTVLKISKQRALWSHPGWWQHL